MHFIGGYRIIYTVKNQNHAISFDEDKGKSKLMTVLLQHETELLLSMGV